MFSFKFYALVASVFLILTHERLRTLAFDTKYDQLHNYANYFDDPDSFMRMTRNGNSSNVTLPQAIMVRLQEGRKQGDKVQILTFKLDPKALMPFMKMASASAQITNKIMEQAAKRKNMSRPIKDKFQYFRSFDEIYGKSQPKTQTGLNKIIQSVRKNSVSYKRFGRTTTTVQYFKREKELYATAAPDNIEISPAPYFKSRDEIYRPPKRDRISPAKYFRSMEELYIRPKKWQGMKQTTQYFKTWDELYQPSKKDEKVHQKGTQNQPFVAFPVLDDLFRRTKKPHIIIVDAFDLNPETVLSMRRRNEIISDIQDEILCILNGTKNYTDEINFTAQEQFMYPSYMPQPIIEIRHESWPEWESIRIQPEDLETAAGFAMEDIVENLNNSTAVNGDGPIYLNFTVPIP